MEFNEAKNIIDNMSHLALCHHWRFAPSGDLLLQGEIGKYFKQKLDAAGGFTPEISKQLGWE